jgi:hypothetical protein
MPETAMLDIPLKTLAWIIVKAREFDAKEARSATAAEDPEDPLGVLEDREDDPTALELATWIHDLTDTQRAQLVALFWLGRDGGTAEEFPALVEQAREARDTPTWRYLLGAPLLAPHLEAGLETLGYDVAEIEAMI